MTTRTRATIGTLTLALAIVAPTEGARADQRESHLDAAERALEELDFHTARNLLDAALRSGDNAAASLHRAYLLSGMVAATFGDRKAAVQAFRRALAIDPHAELPDGLAPKMTAPFAEARKRNRSRSIDVGCAHSNGSGSIFVTVDSDPLFMAAGAVARWSDTLGHPHTEELPRARRYVFAIPDEATEWVQVAVVDEHGNQVAAPCEVQVVRTAALDSDHAQSEEASAGRGDGPLGTPSAQLRGESKHRGKRPLVARWYVWGTLSLGFAAVGTYYGLEARQSAAELNQALQDSPLYQFSDAVEIERRGQRQARLSTLSFGAAAGVAALGAILWLVTDGEAENARRPVVGAAPTRGGASVGLTFAW